LIDKFLNRAEFATLLNVKYSAYKLVLRTADEVKLDRSCSKFVQRNSFGRGLVQFPEIIARQLGLGAKSGFYAGRSQSQNSIQGVYACAWFPAPLVNGVIIKEIQNEL
jgi:hypothetical protein